MEGGTGIRGNLLDPGAQEFYPMSAQIALAHPQIYFSYPPVAAAAPPPPPVAVQYLPSGDGAAPTRSVLLSAVPRQVWEEAVAAAMEAFGAVKAVEMASLSSDGVVTVHFYDLRSAQAAVAEVREQHVRQQNRIDLQHGAAAGNWGGGGSGSAMLVLPHFQQQQQIGGRGLVAGHAVWADYTESRVEEPNQGSLIVFNWDQAAPFASLAEIFQNFGAVKEIRETPGKSHKFVEFFDTRDAASALSGLNGMEVRGRRLVVEFSRPGGHARSGGSRRGSHHLHFPPRLLRTSSDISSSGWSQGSGGSERSIHPPPALSSRGAFDGRVAPVLLKRSNAVVGTAKNTSQTSGSGAGGRKGKSDGGSGSSVSSSSKTQRQSAVVMGDSSSSSSSRKGWNNLGSKNSIEPMLVIRDAMDEPGSSRRDPRTTVMIRNIPNKYSQKLLLNMLDTHCIACNEQIEDEEPPSAYDFVYLPIDFANKCNVGYGFVNFTSPEATLRLYKKFNQQPWEVFNSRKICEVTYARLQGLDALKDHFRNSRFSCDNDDYMPVVFSPPRDGMQLSKPCPIWGRSSPGRRSAAELLNLDGMSAPTSDAEAPAVTEGGEAASSTTASTHAPSDHGDGGEEDERDDEVSSGAGGADGTGCGLSEALLRISLSYSSS